MNRRLFFAAVAAISIICAALSCRELALDGDLAGQWQITSIDHPDGTSTDPEGKNYYSFYRNVAQLTNINDTRVTANMVYDKKASTITLDFPYNEVSQLQAWGITQAGSAVNPDEGPTEAETVTILINRLSASRLVMTAPGGNVISCRKY